MQNIKLGSNTQKAWYPIPTKRSSSSYAYDQKSFSTQTANSPNELYDNIQDFLQMLNLPHCPQNVLIKRLYSLIFKHSVETIQNWFHPSGTGEPFLFRVILTNNRNLQTRLAVLNCLVRDFGFDINQRRRHDLSTILHVATWRNRTDILPNLYCLGANPNMVNVYMETPGQSIQHRAQTDMLLFVHTNSTTPPTYVKNKEKINPDKEHKQISNSFSVSSVLKELAIKLTDARGNRVFYQHYFDFRPVIDNMDAYYFELKSAQSAILDQLQNRNCKIRTVGFQLHKHFFLLASAMPSLYKYINTDILDVHTLIFFLNTYMCSRYFRQKNKPKSTSSLVVQGVNQAVKVTQRILEDFGNGE